MRLLSTPSMLRLGVAALAGLAFSGSAAHAQNLLTNGSFETPPVVGAPFFTYGAGSTALTGWTVGGNSIDHIGSFWTAQDGVQSLDMNGNGLGSISQTIATTIGQTYTISFFIAGNTGGAPTIKNLQAAFGGTLFSTSFDSTGFSNANMGWSARTFTATATSTSTVVSFTSENAGSSAGPALDNVSVVATATAAPEPGTLALLGLGIAPLAGVLVRRRRNRA